ncbi:hypothetical protein Ancab_006935 [Ancistrocladus abbreviatus]
MLLLQLVMFLNDASTQRRHCKSFKRIRGQILPSSHCWDVGFVTKSISFLKKINMHSEYIYFEESLPCNIPEYSIMAQGKTATKLDHCISIFFHASSLFSRCKYNDNADVIISFSQLLSAIEVGRE